MPRTLCIGFQQSVVVAHDINEGVALGSLSAHGSACMQSEAPVFRSPSTRPESALRPHDVQLEANAGTGEVQFRGFAGAIKTHLQWLPLQWTYLVKGAQLDC